MNQLISLYERYHRSAPTMCSVILQVSTPVNGNDVSLKLVLTSKSRAARPLLISISVQAMRYNGRPAANIQKELKEETLLPGKGESASGWTNTMWVLNPVSLFQTSLALAPPPTDLVIPVLVPLSVYHRHMLLNDSMKISALVTDKNNPANTYLAEDDIVLQDPPISLTVSRNNSLLDCSHLLSVYYDHYSFLLYVWNCIF